MSETRKSFEECSISENIERAVRCFDCVYEIIDDKDDDDKVGSIALQCVSGRDSVRVALKQIEDISDIGFKLSAVSACLYDVWQSLSEPIENITNERKNEKMSSLYGAYLILKDCSDDMKER